MTDTVTFRLARSLVAPNLAVLALVVVLISGTFALRARFDSFTEAQERISLARRARAEAGGDRAVLIAAGGAAGGALVLALLGFSLHRSVLRPVRSVANVARRLAGGNRDARVPAGGRGEVGLLADSFNAMAAALSEREEALRLAGDRLQGILDHASAMISVTDVEGRYLLVGRRWEEATGRTAAEVIGHTDAELVPGHATPSRSADLEVIRTGEPVQYERDTITSQGARSYLTVRFHSRTPTAWSTPSSPWPPTSASATAHWRRRSTRRARSRSSWPT